MAQDFDFWLNPFLSELPKNLDFPCVFSRIIGMLKNAVIFALTYVERGTVSRIAIYVNV